MLIVDFLFLIQCNMYPLIGYTIGKKGGTQFPRTVFHWSMCFLGGPLEGGGSVFPLHRDCPGSMGTVIGTYMIAPFAVILAYVQMKASCCIVPNVRALTW